jgi:hypothetical protein
LKQAPGALYIGSGKEGATRIELDDAKAVLSELEARRARASERGGVLREISARPGLE